MSNIKISELADGTITLDSFLALAGNDGVAFKGTVKELQTFVNTIAVLGLKSAISAADAAPTEDGLFPCQDTGTYTNFGGLVVDVSDTITFISVAGTQTVFKKVQIPITLVKSATPTEGSTDVLESGGAFDSLYNKQKTVSGSTTKINANSLIQNGALDSFGAFSGNPSWRTIIDYPIVAGNKILVANIEGGSKYGTFKDAGNNIISVFTVSPNTIFTAPIGTVKSDISLVASQDTVGDVDYTLLKSINNLDSDFIILNINGLKLQDSVESAINKTLLANYSSAYVHALRTNSLSISSQEIEQLDEFINENKDAYFAFKPLSVGVDKVCVQIPDNNANDGEIARSGTFSTYKDKFGVIRDAIENEARLDYSLGKPMLLAEETAENLYKNSPFLGAISGTSGGGTLPTNLGGNNEGDITVLQSAYENGNSLMFTSISQRTNVNLAISVSTGNTYCASGILTILEGEDQVRQFVRCLDVNSVTSESIYLNNKLYLPNDTIGAGVYDVKIIVVATGNGLSSFSIGTGVSFASTAKVIVDTPQFELGEVRTSFIPTNTTNPKTRNLDNYSDFSCDFTNKEGVINLKVANISKVGISNIDFSNGTSAERIRFRFNYSISTALRVEIYSDSVLLGTISTNDFVLTEDNLITLKVQSGNYKLGCNGVVLVSDNTITELPQITKLDLHSANSSGSSPFKGSLEYITVKPINNKEFYSDLLLVNLTTDSITSQDYWQPYIKPYFPQLKFVNKAIGGTTIANVNTDSLSNPTRILTLDTTAKYTTIMGFTNDFAQNIPIGAITDTVDTTAYGGLKNAIERIMARCTGTEIILVTPIYKLNEDVVNTQGATLEDYRNVMRNVQKLYQCKLWEMAYCGINEFNATITIPDGVHPREIGAKLMAKRFIREFNEIVIIV
tara:strand:+ start:138 stop:2852 length:2715 start_codon:yes stop_codon:yes gene_type:complete